MSDGEKKKSIIICEYISTGINYVDDAFARGYIPVLVEGHYVGTPEVVAPFVEERETINRRMKDRVKIIPEQENYEDLLRSLIRSEFGFEQHLQNSFTQFSSFHIVSPFFQSKLKIGILFIIIYYSLFLHKSQHSLHNYSS